MEIEKVDHVGIAVKDSEKAGKFVTEILKGKKIIDESWEYRGMKFRWAYYLIGNQGMLELISADDPDNFINRFIDKHGEGMHHITLKVKNLEESVSWLETRGIRVIDVNTSNPDWKEAFIHPKDAFGVLIQLAEYDESKWAHVYLEKTGQQPEDV